MEMRIFSICLCDSQLSLEAFEPMHATASLFLHLDEGPSNGACLEYAMQHLCYKAMYIQ